MKCGSRSTSRRASLTPHKAVETSQRQSVEAALLRFDASTFLRFDVLVQVQYRAPAPRSAAVAGVLSQRLFDTLFVDDVAVVVRELFARLDVPQGADPDLLVVHRQHRFAVRLARVIDEAR